MKNSVRKAAILVLICFVALGATGCNPIKTKIEHEICKAVSERFAPADSYKCRISGKTADWLRGRVSKVELTGSGVRYSGVCYDELRLTLTNISYNPVAKRITACDNGSFTAVLKENNLTDMVKDKLDSTENVILEITPGKLRVSGVKKVVGIRARAGAEGSLSIKKGCELWFSVDKIELPGLKLSVPGWTGEAISKQINPVYSIDPSKNGLTLTGIECKSHNQGRYPYGKPIKKTEMTLRFLFGQKLIGFPFRRH